MITLTKPEWILMNAKTISLILACLLGLVCFTTACQPTPENEIVTNKGDGRLEEIIANKNEPSNHSIVKGQTTWTENVLNTDGETFLKIDASINVPTASKLPVISIKPASFTQEQVDRVFEYFAQGKPIISGDSPLTKEEITEIILELKLDYAKFKKGDDGYDDHETAESFEQFINGYEKMLETAPDSHDYIDSAMLRIEPETMAEGVSVKIDTGKDEYALFTVSNPTSHYYSSSITFSDGNGNRNRYGSQRDLYGKDANNLQTTIQQAREQAMKVLKELDLDDYHVLDVLTGISLEDQKKQGYIVICTPTVHDVGLTYSEMTRINDPNIIGDSDGRLIYADTGRPVEFVPSRLDQSSIEIQIDDTGITSFSWDNIYYMISMENDNVQLLSFDEIKRICLQQMKSNFSYDNKENGTVYVIDRIELGLVVAPKKNNIGEFLLVPAWTFYGSWEFPEDIPMDDLFSNNSIYTSHITFNAIDGSLITD